MSNVNISQSSIVSASSGALATGPDDPLCSMELSPRDRNHALPPVVIVSNTTGFSCGCTAACRLSKPRPSGKGHWGCQHAHQGFKTRRPQHGLVGSHRRAIEQGFLGALACNPSALCGTFVAKSDSRPHVHTNRAGPSYGVLKRYQHT
jgi:hypothetical protein